MGTRFDFELSVNLREEVPQNVVRILTFLLRPGENAPEDEPDHEFFGSYWRRYPFASWATADDPNVGDSACSFRRVLRYTQHGIDHYQYTVHLRFVAKMETVAEVGLPFAMWLALWSDQNEFVGHYKAENDRHPTLLYFHDRELYLREVTAPPQRVTDGHMWE